jgi:hypothetical protein
MGTGIEEIVHIIPLGHEFERAIRPFDTAKANRVYLIVDSGAGSSNGTSDRDICMQELQEHYTQMVTDHLMKEKQIDVIVRKTMTFDLTAFLKELSSIIYTELAKGSRVHINMSGSGRLAAVAATLAGMAHGIDVYYVHSERFAEDNGVFDDTNERYRCGVSICKKNIVTNFTNFQFVMADEVETLILQKLYNEKNRSGVSSSELVKVLEENRVEGFESTQDEYSKVRKYQDKNTRNDMSRKLMKLNHSILKGMIDDKKYITKEKSGRKMLFTITPSGEYALHLSGKETSYD